jgi:hypothetical protein
VNEYYRLFHVEQVDRQHRVVFRPNRITAHLSHTRTKHPSGSGPINLSDPVEEDCLPESPALVTPVPTMSEWALFMLAMLIAGFVFVRRKQLSSGLAKRCNPQGSLRWPFLLKTLRATYCIPTPLSLQSPPFPGAVSGCSVIPAPGCRRYWLCWRSSVGRAADL